MTDVALFVAVFLACLVEAVEATTIVVAAGSARDWRSALTGTVSSLLVLAVVVAAAGPAIMLLPLNVLRLIVGGLLLVFGLQWLRKAVLRASGLKPVHDEDLIYARHLAGARSAASDRRLGGVDWFGFTLAFKGVLLEGLEVVFIVLTFATNQGNLPVALAAAGAAVLIVAAVGAIVRGPLSRVPENTLKFIVGVMLASFGVFWGVEGTGVTWPGADAALLVIVPGVAVFCLALTLALRRRGTLVGKGTRPAESLVTDERAGGTELGASPEEAEAPATPVDSPSSRRTPMRARRLRRRLVAFGLFWYDFVLGDDWQVALGVILLLLVTAFAHGWADAWVLAPVVLAGLIAYGTLRAARA